MKTNALELTRPLDDFWSEFPDEEACIGRLKADRWKNGPVCPYCGNTRFYGRVDGPRLRCAGCHYTFSFKVGTLFHDTTIPIRTWFAAIWIVTNSAAGVPSTQLARELGLHQNTAWSILNRLRRATSTMSFAGTVEGRTNRKQAIAAPPATGRRYEPKFKLDMSFDEAVDRFAQVHHREMQEESTRSATPPHLA